MKIHLYQQKLTKYIIVFVIQLLNDETNATKLASQKIYFEIIYIYDGELKFC